MFTLITRCGFFTAACLAAFACDNSSTPSSTSTDAGAQTSTAVGVNSTHVNATDTGNASANVDASVASDTSTRSDDTALSTPSTEGEPSTSSSGSESSTASNDADASVSNNEGDASLSASTSATTGQLTTASDAGASATTEATVDSNSSDSNSSDSNSESLASESDGGQGSVDAGAPVVRQVIDVPAPGSPINAPEGCIVEALTETEEGCEYYITCESEQIRSRVDPTGAEWSSCGSGLLDDRFYRFSGIEGLDACTFASNFCLQLPDVLESTPMCEVDIDDTPDGTCQYINECTQSLDLGHGVTAEVRSSWTMLSCYPGQTGGEGCSCTGDTVDSRSWHVDAPNTTNPCELTQAICFGDEPLNIGRAEGTAGECETEPSFASDMQCQLEEHCTFAKPYGDATTLSVTEIDTGDCTNLDGDEWACECNANGMHFLRMSMSGDTASDAACSTALDVCRQPTIEGNGALSCSQVLSTEDDECQLDFECEQPMIAGTHDVTRTPSGNTWCYVSPDGWQCECRYDHTGVEFVLDAPLSPGQACSQAFDACTPKFEL